MYTKLLMIANAIAVKAPFILMENTTGTTGNTGDNFASEIATALQTSVLKPLQQIAGVIAVIGVVACGIAWLFSPDPKGAEKAKSGLIACVCALVLIFFADDIIKVVVNAISGEEGYWESIWGS